MSSDTIAVPSPVARVLFRHQPFLFFFVGRGFSGFAYQMGAVAFGWQVYALTHSAFDLGMIGLTQFLPMASLTFLGGHAVDRYDRKRVVQICQFVEGSAAAFLAWGSLAGWLRVPEIFIVVAIFGSARAFESPATSALLPAVVPTGLLQKGTAVLASVTQTATIIGPALSGLMYAARPGLPYVMMALCWLFGSVLNGAMPLDRPPSPKEPPTLSALFAGVGFVRRNPPILGTISLDLFAVLLGGATALLPIYARDILHTGPWGLGVLRGAPAVGALVMTSLLARNPISHRVGRRMFQAVIVFGIATIVFGLSHFLLLSLVALACMGAADMVSVVIRLSLVQLATPDDMRGRVGAVNYLFVSASNQLGEFESGMAATLFGAVPAVVLGGVGTVLVALLWMKLFPSLAQVDRLE
jgi:MFS family permease